MWCSVMHKLDDDPQNKLLFSGVEYCFEFDILKIVFNLCLVMSLRLRLIYKNIYYFGCILPSNANSCNFCAISLFLSLKYEMS